MTTPRQRRIAYVAWASICIIWGTTYLGIKVGLETIPPFAMGAIRYLAAGGLLLAVLRARGERVPSPRTWPGFLLLGLLMLGFGNGGVAWAEQHVPSGLAAVLVSTTPFWMVGIEAVLANGEVPSVRALGGLAVGFLGVVLLVGPDIFAGGLESGRVVLGVVSLQLACVGWAAGSSWGKRHAGEVGPLASASMQMLGGGLVLAVAATWSGEWHTLHFSPRSAGALVYLTLLGAVAGYGAYIYALKHLPVSFVSLYSYINPVIAVALGTLLLGEPFHLRMAFAIALILAGMAVVSATPGPRRS